MARNRGISVGAKITGDAKGFKSAAEDAKKATESLRKDISKKSKESSASFESIGKALLAVGAAIGTARVAFRTFEKVMMSAQSTGDALTHQFNGIKGASTALMQNLATADFSSSLWDAFYAAKDLSAALDDLGDRTLSVNILSAAGQARMSELRRISRDVTKSEEERLKAVKEIEEIATRELKSKQQLALTHLTALIKEQTKKNSLTEQEGAMIFSYMANYSRFTKAQHDALNDYMELKKTVISLEENQLHTNKALIRPVEYLEEAKRRLLVVEQRIPEELLKYAGIFPAINKLTDDQRKAIAEIGVQWYGASKAFSDYMAGIDRVSNRLDGGTVKIPVTIEYDFGLPPPSKAPNLGERERQTDSLNLNDLFGLPNFDNATLTALKQLNYEIEYSTQLVDELQGAFRDIFSATGGGFDAMADAFISAIQRMAAEAIAKMAVFALLNALTGGSMSWASQMLGGRNFSQFMGFTNSTDHRFKSGGGNINVNVTGKIGARDIFLAGQRYNDVLNDNT